MITKDIREHFPLDYQSILNRIDMVDPVRYAKTRNHIEGDVTKLSPYITRGVITLPFIRERIYARYHQKASEKIIQELAWREYFYRVWEAQGDAIFKDLRFEQKEVRTNDLVSGIVHAQTGITIIDDLITKLKTTGYMHNHARMWVAMMASSVAGCHWSTMSRWMYYHLLDGDIASNTLSWQWVAGTTKSEPYRAHQELINACSGSKQKNTFLDIERNEIGKKKLPESLKQTEPFNKKTLLPKGDEITLKSSDKVFFYHPWHLDPLWKKDENPTQRIFVLEPSHFEHFPVSENVLTFMMSLAQSLFPDIQIYVGEIGDMNNISEVKELFTRGHPCVKHFPGIREPRPELFPDVPRIYYQSFFAYWKQIKKYYPEQER